MPTDTAPTPRLLEQAALAPSLRPQPSSDSPLDEAPAGPPPLPEFNLVIMSYESLRWVAQHWIRTPIYTHCSHIQHSHTSRSDIEWVSTIPWLYCVLDEGHIIKSPKAKITLAAKRVHASHR